MSTMTLKLAEGRRVPKEDGSDWPEAGETVPVTAYIRRRLRDGDLVPAEPAPTPPAPEPPADPQPADAAPAEEAEASADAWTPAEPAADTDKTPSGRKARK